MAPQRWCGRERKETDPPLLRLAMHPLHVNLDLYVVLVEGLLADMTTEHKPTSEPPTSSSPYNGWTTDSHPQMHQCYCIGCCKKCGTCRTWPAHTPDYCALVVRQMKERKEMAASGR